MLSVSGLRKRNIGEEYTAPYFSVIRILVESVLPRTLAGTLFLVSYGVGDPSKNAFSLVSVLMIVRCWNSA